MAAGSSSMRQAMAGLSPRERRLLLVLGITLATLGVAGLWYWSSTVLDGIEDQRDATVQVLRLIRDERTRIRARQAEADQAIALFRTPAPALTSFVEQAAREANVSVDSATDRPAPTAEPRRYTRRSVSIRLRHVDLQSLVGFMGRLEHASFPLAITSVRIRRRFGESNSYDVDDMVITTWDRNAAAPIAPRPRGAGGTSGTTRSTEPR